ncbi:uncharacterized protein LOC130673057 isoform X1 [Microplitis mediator]|uniref:uncharacterized protein LOC130673057 isoform X1 n=1 Tax=Microplitis mediator TaxID=375433 RepID=UPI0025578877|nr:uncharacterized protein LOC130673057 isoform X1 [Microplitis mediator]XP_057333933.1 uncharacterized protein LOC130673057 isoform X1 [Microplitis mediator]
MSPKLWEGQIECSCTRACFCTYANFDSIQEYCLDGDFFFKELDDVIKLHADLKKGIEPRIKPNGKTFKEAGKDFFEYRMVMIINAYDFILDVEKCTGTSEIIKGTDYEKIYLEAKEKYSEAIDKLMKISEEDIRRLENDCHYEIDL